MLAKLECTCGGSKCKPTITLEGTDHPGLEYNVLPRDKTNRVSTNIERTLMMNVKKKEELLTPTSDGEPWIKEPMDLNDILPDVSTVGESDQIDYLEAIGFHGTPENKQKIRALCEEYRHLFSTTLRNTPSKCPPMKLNVQTQNWFTRKNQRPPRIQSGDKDKATRQLVEQMLTNGIIRPSKATAWSQVLLVPKPNSTKHRLCIDYRNLNECTIGEHWPLPNIQLVIRRIGQKKYKFYGKMDFTSGFWQNDLENESRHYSAFITFMGLYEFCRVAMGLKGAPSYFQMSLAAYVLVGLLYITCELYIDDVIVGGDTIDHFIENLREVFKRFDTNKITLNPTKCSFGMDSTEFVGHVLDGEGKRMSHAKIQKVLDFARPKSIKELRSFLGLVNYFRDHIKHHSELVRPLLDLLKEACGTDQLDSKKGKSSFKQLLWNTHTHESYNRVVETISKCPKLFFMEDDDKTHPIVLCTDASDYGYGAYLYQLIDGKHEKPIAFSSKTFSKDQIRWNVPEKEAYGIYHAILHFEYLLRDKKFTIKTDHKNLIYINESGSPKVIRWKLAIMEFNFDIEHIEGIKNIVADYFSRVKPEDTEILAMWYQPQDTQENRTEIIEQCHAWVWAPTSELGKVVLSYDREYIARMIDSRQIPIAIPNPTLTNAGMNNSSRNMLSSDTEIDKTSKTLFQLQTQPIKTSFVHTLPHPTTNNIVTNTQHKTIMEVIPSNIVAPPIVLPPRIDVVNATDIQQAGVLEETRIHDLHTTMKLVHGLLPGHHGVERTLTKLIGYLKSINQQPWKGLRSDVARFIRQCPCCQKMSNLKPVVQAKPFTLASYTPWDKINIDAMGPFPVTPDGYQHIIVVIDCFTRFVELFPAKTTGALDAKHAILSCVGRYGIPNEIVTDGGSQFKNETIQTLIDMMGTDHRITLAYSKEENAMVERANKEVLRHLASMTYDTRIREDWIDFLPLIQRIINATPHSNTGVAPSQLLFGNAIQLDRGIFLPINKLENQTPSNTTLQSWTDKMLTKQSELLKLAETLQRSKDTSNTAERSSTTYTSFEINSYVLVAYPHTRMGQRPPVKTMTPFRGPMRILSVNESTYTLQDLVTLKEETVHVSLLKPFDFDPKHTNPTEVARHDTDEFEVETILQHTGDFSRKHSLQFQVQWKGYGPEHNTWEPWSSVRDNTNLHSYLKKLKLQKWIPKRTITKSQTKQINKATRDLVQQT